MKNLHKLLLPSAMLLGVFALLASCQSPPAQSSSVIEEVFVDTESAVCEDLKPEQITSSQYDSLDGWAQDYLVRLAEKWRVRCA